MSHFGIEKRKSMRFSLFKNIEYACNTKTNGDIFFGITRDISFSGMNLFILDGLDEGQEITIKNNIPFTSEKATIRWIRKLKDNIYIAGLMFVFQKTF